ncbi:MAG: DUF883 family protein [Verrucomicrobiae bacterium]|nr:DUF883 family protein [Verrucomicrobiae bacterium]
MTTKTRTQNIEKLKADLEKLVKDGEKLLRDEADNAKSNGQEVRDKLVETLETAKEFCGDLDEKARRQLSEIDESVHNRPYAYAGIACGVGVLVGLLLNKKS